MSEQKSTENRETQKRKDKGKKRVKRKQDEERRMAEHFDGLQITMSIYLDNMW